VDKEKEQHEQEEKKSESTCAPRYILEVTDH
jgi:hypothetical protein